MARFANSFPPWLVAKLETTGITATRALLDGLADRSDTAAAYASYSSLQSRLGAWGSATVSGSALPSFVAFTSTQTRRLHAVRATVGSLRCYGHASP